MAQRWRPSGRTTVDKLCTELGVAYETGLVAPSGTPSGNGVLCVVCVDYR